MTRAVTWAVSFGMPSLVLYLIAPALLVFPALLAVHALVYRGGERWP